jgi:hypothetical protein
MVRINAQRLAVINRNRISGVAKLMREPCFLPLKASSARRFTSWRVATCKVTVFILSPPSVDVVPEIRQKNFGIGKFITPLGLPDEAVVTFPGLVVVAQHTIPIDNKRKTILEMVAWTSQRFRNAPNNNFNKHADIEHEAFINEQLGLHVGVNYNNGGLLSITPTTWVIFGGNRHICARRLLHGSKAASCF